MKNLLFFFSLKPLILLIEYIRIRIHTHTHTHNIFNNKENKIAF